MQDQKRQLSGERRQNKVSISFYTSSDLLELIDLSAARNDLNRSLEVTRLLLIALEQPPADPDPAATEVTGHVV